VRQFRHRGGSKQFMTIRGGGRDEPACMKGPGNELSEKSKYPRREAVRTERGTGVTPRVSTKNQSRREEKGLHLKTKRVLRPMEGTVKGDRAVGKNGKRSIHKTKGTRIVA